MKKETRNGIIVIVIAIIFWSMYAFLLIQLNPESEENTLIRASWKNGYYSAQNSALRGNFDNFKADSLEFEKLLINE